MRVEMNAARAAIGVLLIGSLIVALASCGGGDSGTTGGGGTTAAEPLTTGQSTAASDLSNNALAEQPADDDLAQVLDDTLDVAGDSDMVDGQDPGGKSRQQELPNLAGITMPTLPFNRRGLTFSGDFTKSGTLYDPSSFSASGSLTVTSDTGTDLTVQTAAGSGTVTLTIQNGKVVTSTATYGVNATIKLTSDIQEQAVEDLLQNAASQSPADPELDQTLEDLNDITGDGDAVGGSNLSTRQLVQPVSLPVVRNGVTFDGTFTKSGTLLDPSSFQAQGTVTATSSAGTNLTLTASGSAGNLTLAVSNGTIVTSTATYTVNLDTTVTGTGSTQNVVITRNGTTVYEVHLTRTASGVISARSYSLTGTVYVAPAAAAATRQTDTPEWLRVTYTNLSFQVNIATAAVSVIGGQARVEIGDTPSGSADLSVSSGSLNGQLTLNGQPVGTLIIQPPLVILIPAEGVGGGTSSQKRITVTRNGTTIFDVDTVRTATGVVGTRTYTLNGTVYVAPANAASRQEDLPEWVRLTYTNLVYQISLLTQSATLASGTVKIEMGDSPSASGTMSVSSGSLSGTLEKNGQTVATVKVVNGLIVIIPVTGA